MKFTLNWLKEYLDTDAMLDEITEVLTAIGLEVEEVSNPSESLGEFKVAQILDAKPHPDADKLQVCRVQTGVEELQIVCGAPNARAGINVVLAPVGAIIPTNGMKIKRSKIRGVESHGMLCSAAELGLGEDHAGIIEMPASNDNLAKNFVDIAGLNDPMIEIAITPNRADCLGVYGIARDLAAAGLGTLKNLPMADIKDSGDSPVHVKIEDEMQCSLFLGRYFKGVTNTPSPEWLQQRLKAIGVKPISALVDITNYFSYSYGRPMHVYDAQKITGNLYVRHSKCGERFTALDDKEYALQDNMIVVADDAGVQGLGGIIGGTATGCSEQTQHVFLEVAQFDALTIAKTGRELGIITDARYRFERHVDSNFAHRYMDLASQMILDICGGEVSTLVECGKVDDVQRSIAFDAAVVKQYTGVEVDSDTATNILTALGFHVEGADVIVPSWRADVEGVADLVEEIIRIHGFDTIPETPLPESDTLSKAMLSPSQMRVVNARHSLAATGMHEVVSWSFMASELAQHFTPLDDELRLQNPISAELDYMRPTVIPNLLEMVARNSARAASDLALFETGPVFLGAQPGQQKTVIAGVRSGLRISKNHYDGGRNADAFDAKADLITALDAMGAPVNSLQTNPDKVPNWYHPGRSVALMLGKSVLGVCGEIHPAIVKQLDITQAVVGFEAFPDALPQPKQKGGKARGKLEISDYQASQRDFAFIIDEATSVGDILTSVQKVDKQLIADVSLFDIYTGKGVEDGKRSIAVSVTIQPKDQTITDEVLERLSQNIIKAVAQKGGVLRR